MILNKYFPIDIFDDKPKNDNLQSLLYTEQQVENPRSTLIQEQQVENPSATLMQEQITQNPINPSNKDLKIENSRTKLTDELFRFANQKNFSELFAGNLDLINEIKMLYRAKNIDDYIQGLFQRKDEIKTDDDFIFSFEDHKYQAINYFIENLKSNLKEIEKPKSKFALIKRIDELAESKSKQNPGI